MAANHLSLKIQAFGRYYAEQADQNDVCLADINAVRSDIHNAFWIHITRAEEAYRKDDDRGVDAWLAEAKKAYFRGVVEVRQKRARP